MMTRDNTRRDVLKIACSVEESGVALAPYPVTVCLLDYSQGLFIQTGSVNLSEMSCTLGAVSVRCEQVMQDLNCLPSLYVFILHSTTSPFFRMVWVTWQLRTSTVVYV